MNIKPAGPPRNTASMGESNEMRVEPIKSEQDKNNEPTKKKSKKGGLSHSASPTCDETRHAKKFTEKELAKIWKSIRAQKKREVKQTLAILKLSKLDPTTAENGEFCWRNSIKSNQRKRVGSLPRIFRQRNTQWVLQSTSYAHINDRCKTSERTALTLISIQTSP